jgi:hypothetical protein
VTIAIASSTAMKVVDESADRPDLARRREVKYAVDGADVDAIRSVLGGSCQQVVHNQRVSKVRSIYFDDITLSACRANIDGLGIRRKLRLRWYDLPRPSHDFFLEIKWRQNKVTGKHRLQMYSPEPLHELTYRQIITRLAACVPQRFQAALIAYPEPVAIVEYSREHFVARTHQLRSKDGAPLAGQLRLTIDYNLAFYDQSMRQTISSSFRKPFGDLVVLEGKVPVGYEAELRHLMFPITARPTRCSKYLYACQTLDRLAGLH